MIRCSTLATILLLTASSLITPPATAAPCQKGNPKNTAYMEREGDKRCEGITSPDVARTDFDLRSFMVGQFTATDPLSLRIPKVATLPNPPDVRIQSTQKYYQLDPLNLQSVNNQWQFRWSSDVLRQENIPLRNLRGLAASGNERILLPLLLNRSTAYEIRIYTGGRAKAITLSIQTLTGQERYTSRQANRPGDEVAFLWSGTDSQKKPLPPGRYVLKVEAHIEQPNAPLATRSLTRQFEHNPAWLK
jgi:hypothetical protein